MVLEVLEDLLEAVNTSMFTLLKKRSSLQYEAPVDVNRHDDSMNEVLKDIDLLREMRTKLEERISS